MPFPGKFNAKGDSGGRIGRIPRAKMDYYSKVASNLTCDDLDDDSRELFVRNVVSRLHKEVGEVARNQTVSLYIETVISSMNIPNIAVFLKGLREDWASLIEDKFASHVVQKTFAKCFDLLYTSKKEDLDTSNDSDSGNDSDEEDEDSVVDMVIKLCEASRDRIEQVAMHTYASHVFRSLFQLLCGVRIADSELMTAPMKFNHKKLKRKLGAVKPELEGYTADVEKVPEQFMSFFKLIVKRILGSDDYQAMFGHPQGSPFIQYILNALKLRDPVLCSFYCDQILKQAFPPLNKDMLAIPSHMRPLPDVFTSTTSAFIVELALRLTDGTNIAQLLAEDGALLQYILPLAMRKEGFHTVIKVLQLLDTKAQFLKMWDQFAGHISSIWDSNQPAVLTEIANCCVRFHTKQTVFIKELKKASECEADTSEANQSFLRCLAYLTKRSQIDSPQPTTTTDDTTPGETGLFYKVPRCGSMLVQSLFNFGNVQELTINLLSLDTSGFASLCLDPCGSRIIDAFYNSEHVAVDNKNAVTAKISKQIKSLSLSTHGSRVVDAAWDHASLKFREKMVAEIVKHTARLEGTAWGRTILYRMSAHLYKSSPNAWRQVQQQSKSSKREAASEFLDELESEMKVQKVDKSSNVKSQSSKSRKKSSKGDKKKKRRKDKTAKPTF